MNLTTRYLQSVADRPEIEIATLVNTIMLDAVQFGASDVHIEPWESTIVVRVRLNGVLSELVHLPLELMEKIAGRIKIMANLVSYQTDVPQEGHVSSHPDHGNVELRISSFPTVRGEKIVIRIFDPSNRSFDLAALGFEEETLQALIKLLARPSGLILLTGPTGSGKTTALYAALSHLVHRSGPTISIATVEDPVEFHLPMVSQTQVNLARELTYARALRSLMRQDPQVIMVGEIRDAETAGIAVQAGMTGHLVLSTIHSGSTAGIFARLINMDIEPFLLSSSISAVMGLRLVRRNCPDCLETYDPTPAQLALAALEPGTQFRRGAGCAHCLGTGFAGRSAITEIMVLNEAMRDAILRKMPTRALQDFAIEQGMATLWHSGLRRSLAGETTLEEIMRVVAVDHG